MEKKKKNLSLRMAALLHKNLIDTCNYVHIFFISLEYSFKKNCFTLKNIAMINIDRNLFFFINKYELDKERSVIVFLCKLSLQKKKKKCTKARSVRYLFI